MILVLGGRASGKRSFVRTLGYSPQQMSHDPKDDAPVVFDAQELVRDCSGCDTGGLIHNLAQKEVVICAEVGAGIVPLDDGDRAFREDAGRLAVALADRAECVVRVVCGIPQVLKGILPDAEGKIPASAENGSRPDGFSSAGACGYDANGADIFTHDMGGYDTNGEDACSCSMNGYDISEEDDAGEDTQRPVFLSIFRHGPTRANRAHRYQGQMDEPLDWEGEEAVCAVGSSPSVGLVYVSPLSRSRQTARIMFPNAQQVVVDDLKEMDFGDFDGFTYKELSDDPRYSAWVDSNCTIECPHGESREQFADRIIRGIRWVLADACDRGLAEAVVVAHGGTAMATFWRLSESDRDYFDWQIGACEGLRARVLEFRGGVVCLDEPVKAVPADCFEL